MIITSEPQTYLVIKGFTVRKYLSNWSNSSFITLWLANKTSKFNNYKQRFEAVYWGTCLLFIARAMKCPKIQLELTQGALLKKTI